MVADPKKNNVTMPLDAHGDFKYAVTAANGAVQLDLVLMGPDNLRLEPRPSMDADFAEKLAGALQLAANRARVQKADA